MYSGFKNYPSCCQPCPPYIYVYVPMICASTQPDCCETMKVLHDLDVQQSNTPQTALIGGSEDVSLSIEYLVESGASSPSVTLTTTSDGTTSTWSATAPDVGYHVEEGALTVKPGTKVTLAVNNVTARVRWCETICC
jgi:hypothetical protein